MEKTIKGKTAEVWFELGLSEKEPEKGVEYYTKTLEINPKDGIEKLTWDTVGVN